MLYEFDVFQVVFDDADQMTDTFLLLLQVLEKREESYDAAVMLRRQTPSRKPAAARLTCLISLRRSASTL